MRASRWCFRAGHDLDEDGRRFYRFDDIPKPKPFKDLYRSPVDAAPWDAAEHVRIVNEIKSLSG